MSESMNTPEWREAELRARVRELEYQLERWQEQVKSVQGEVDFLRGVGCMEDGDGPCGACLKCQKTKVKELEAGIFNMRFQASMGKLENTSQIRAARREVALAKTILNQNAKKAVAKA